MSAKYLSISQIDVRRKHMKIVAFNLPQFHEIPENNEWWGNGFTEWTNIKADNKYSDGIKPLNGNYYNFLEKSTMQWQADLCILLGESYMVSQLERVERSVT